MAGASRHHFTARDGIALAWHAHGAADAPPVILLHGLFSSATVNWLKFGHAAAIAAAGRRVIMPDLRAHGDSGAPHDPVHYPADVLVDDLVDLIDHLALDNFDLGGFSLGARTAVRAVLAGVRPRRLALAGMGLAGLAGWTQRGAFFQRALASFDTARRGDDVWMAVQFIKTTGVDRVAAAQLLTSFTDTPPDALAALTMPTLVLCGVDDADNGSAPDLAAALPNARFAAIPGTHMSSVTGPELGAALAAFFSETAAR